MSPPSALSLRYLWHLHILSASRQGVGARLFAGAAWHEGISFKTNLQAFFLVAPLETPPGTSSSTPMTGEKRPLQLQPVTHMVHSCPATDYVKIPSGFSRPPSPRVLKKQNIVVKRGIMQSLLKRGRLHVLAADFTFLKNPSPRTPFSKVGGADGLGGRGSLWRG